MDKQTVLDHFGSVGAAAKAIGVTSAAISQWGDKIPKLRECQIELITGGALVASFSTPTAETPPAASPAP